MFPDLGSQYSFIKEIARGGTGVVHLALDIHTGHLVAIKTLFESMTKTNPELLEKFKIESNIYLMLSHPNIVKLKNLILRNGSHLVMEFVDGKTIDQYIQYLGRPIPYDVCVAMMKDVVSAIGYAHNKKIAIAGYQGVLHLDIKPGNVLISKHGEIKIIDYGISNGTNEKRGDKIMGSPMYMAPEQLDLKNELTNKTDIYSLGVLFYNMIVGKPPYPKMFTQQEIFNEIRNKPLKSIKLDNLKIQSKIQYIIDKATRKSPNLRYQSCSEMLKDLENVN